MALAPLSAGFQSLIPLPTIKLGLSGAASRVGRFVYILGPSPTSSPVRLGVSPAATSTPTGVFDQWFEALFPHTGTLDCEVCQPGPPAAVSLVSCSFAHPTPQSATSLGPLAAALEHFLSAQLPVSDPPTSLDECFFFISLVVRLPYSSIFCEFWLFFVFKLLLSFFWLCEEAQCVYLCLHLGRKSLLLLLGFSPYF